MRVFLILLTLCAAATAAGAQPAAVPPASSTLDFEFFKTRVQPIFLAKRPGHARCITCHAPARRGLIELNDGHDDWHEAQSRQNFDGVAARGRAGRPGGESSPDASAGEVGRRRSCSTAAAGTGQSKADPEWQTLAAWVRTGRSRRPTTPASGLDFEVYRTRIEPIFLKERAADEGAGMCVNCHRASPPACACSRWRRGATTWTEAQSRQNFEAVKRVVVPGDPAKSPLAVHPLAPTAGGDAQHTGGKFWTVDRQPGVSGGRRLDKDRGAWQPDRQRPRRPSTSSSSDERVQPIFLAKRPGHARCITCHRTGTPRLIELKDGQTPARGAVAAELRGVAARRRRWRS